ncbi:hypothetical protein V6N11_025684 [Hibiscus sabdariffa]|uniref:Uncharacterized protein n=1 Tax=Hibiscus sabdariffa TaxID=183260 RepID=A0ABR2STB7_9ROSI
MLKSNEESKDADNTTKVMLENNWAKDFLEPSHDKTPMAERCEDLTKAQVFDEKDVRQARGTSSSNIASEPTLGGDLRACDKQRALLDHCDMVMKHGIHFEDGGRVYIEYSSFSVLVDLGDNMTTEIKVDVSTNGRLDLYSLICAQLGLEFIMWNSSCPLYDTVFGQKVLANLDEVVDCKNQDEDANCSESTWNINCYTVVRVRALHLNSSIFTVTLTYEFFKQVKLYVSSKNFFLTLMRIQFQHICGCSKFFFSMGKVHSFQYGSSRKQIDKTLKSLVSLYSTYSSQVVFMILKFLLKALGSSSSMDVSQESKDWLDKYVASDDWKFVIIKRSGNIGMVDLNGIGSNEAAREVESLKASKASMDQFQILDNLGDLKVFDKMGVREIAVKEGENIDVKCGGSNMESEINTKRCAVMVSEMDPIDWDNQTQGVVAPIQCTKSTSTLAITQIRGTMGVESIREDIGMDPPKDVLGFSLIPGLDFKFLSARKLESDAKELIITSTNQVDMGNDKKEVASQRILVTEEANGGMIKRPLLVLVVDEKFYKNGRQSKMLDHVSYGIQAVAGMKEIIETMGMSFVGIQVDKLNIFMENGVWNNIIIDQSILKGLECSMARKHILTVVNGDGCFVEPPPNSLQSLILKSVKNVVMNKFVSDNMKIKQATRNYAADLKTSVCNTWTPKELLVLEAFFTKAKKCCVLTVLGYLTELINDSKEVDMTKNMVVFSVERELINFTEPFFEDIVVVFVAGRLDKKKVVASRKLKVHGGHNFRMHVRQLQVVVSRGIIHGGLVVVQYELSSPPLMFSDALTEDKAISNAENGVRSLFAPEVFESLGTIALDSQFLEPDGLCPNHNPNLEVQSSKAFGPGRETILSEAANMIGHGFNFDMNHKLTTLL